MKDLDFMARRKKVLEYIIGSMQKQGATAFEAIEATTCIHFWSSKDVDNLYRCITSDLEPKVIQAIVAHDFNGLAREDVCFLPKSSQFAVI